MMIMMILIIYDDDDNNGTLPGCKLINDNDKIFIFILRQKNSKLFEFFCNDG